MEERNKKRFFRQFYRSLGFPDGSDHNRSACNAGDLGSMTGLGRSPGEGNSYPLQYFGLKNCMDSTVHGGTNSWTQWSDFHFHQTHYIRIRGLGVCILTSFSVLPITGPTWEIFIFFVKNKITPVNWTVNQSITILIFKLNFNNL